MKSIRAALEKKKRDATTASLTTLTSSLDPNGDQKPASSKYQRKGDVNRLEQERLSQLVVSLKSKEKTPSEALTNENSSNADVDSDSHDKNSKNSKSTSSETINTFSEHSIMLKFRQLGQPIKLFGETSSERLERLKEVQIKNMETRLNGGQRNIMAEVERETERENADRLLLQKGSEHLSKGLSNTATIANKHVYEHDEKYSKMKSRSDFPSNGRKQYIRYSIKHWFYLWEREITPPPRSQTNDDEDNNPANTSSTSNISQKTSQSRPDIHHSQTVAYKDTLKKMKPFFVRLYHDQIDDEMLLRLENICTFCEEREYVLANEEYLKIAIGSATWPMGVTKVGIHDRTGRDKITFDKIAHIMNDEVTRLYLHGIKRLLSFAQSKYPTVPSKMIQH